jgi:hypothetical protein
VLPLSLSSFSFWFFPVLSGYFWLRATSLRRRCDCYIIYAICRAICSCNAKSTAPMQAVQVSADTRQCAALYLCSGPIDSACGAHSDSPDVCGIRSVERHCTDEKT